MPPASRIQSNFAWSQGQYPATLWKDLILAVDSSFFSRCFCTILNFPAIVQLLQCGSIARETQLDGPLTEHRLLP